MNDKKMCDCNQGRMTCTCRDVIGEVIEEDSKRLTAPTVGEHAALEASPAALTIDQVELVGLVRDLALRSGKAARPLIHAAALELESQAREIESLNTRFGMACKDLAAIDAALDLPVRDYASTNREKLDAIAALKAQHEQDAQTIKVLQAMARQLKTEPSGVVRWPEADEIMQMAFEEGQPGDDASGYYFELEEFDLFLQRLMEEVARLNSSPVRAGWMMPTAKQLEQALESVPSFHDLSAELIAPAMLGHLRDVISAGEYGDAYRGARDDMAIWKRRALESETKVREQDQVIENLGNALNAENGPIFMGEPVMPASAGDERALYEQSCKERAASNGRGYEAHYFKRQAGVGEYLNPGAEHGWQVWQQARADLSANHSEQVRQMVPDGWKLVPVEPTPEMISAAEEAHMPFGDMDIALRCALFAAPSAGSHKEQGE